MRSFTPTLLIIFTALFIVVVGNSSFFSHVIEVYPFNGQNIFFLLSLGIVLYAVLVIILSLVSFKYTIKPILFLSLIITASVSYFMQSYNIVMDKTMIENVLQTNMDESLDLLSIRLLITLLLLALIPAFIIYKVPLRYRGFKTELTAKIKTILLHLILIAVLLFAFSKYYTSFFREHKTLRLYTNPISTIYNSVAYIHEQLKDNNIPMKIIGQDAKIEHSANRQRKIVIMVVGEAVRADHFSLNGYEKETNPLLKKEDVINFQKVYSCGTTTAVSVPCMFSVYDRKEYDSTKGKYTYNVLDVLAKSGVDVLWRDNNSDSKGVATRITYQNYKSDKLNTVCDGECRDEGMLVGLDQMIQKNDDDILIILHQMGNHGPAYFQRYPKSFEKFTPVCQTNQLEECTKEEISNAYDNSLLYTDYFLSKVIALLKKYDQNAQTAMIYMSDHGESLGEHGLYLHGLPYFMAPEHQKHVASVMWFGEHFPTDKEKLRAKASQEYTHDNIFSTLLGLFDVQTGVYKKAMDMLRE